MSASLSLVVPVQPQVLSPETLDVSVLDSNIRQAAKDYRKSVMCIAYWGFRLRYALMDDWSSLGVKDEDAYRESLGLSQSTWYSYLRIGQVLCTVKLEDLMRITPTNANLIIRVDPALWHDFSWVREAQTLNSAQLSTLIVQRHRQLGSAREPQATFSVRVPYTAKLFLTETVEKFRKENNLKSAGEALELLVADVHDRPNVMTAVRRAHTYIQWARFKFRSSPKAKESSEIQWLLRAQNLLYRAYWAVRTSHSGDIHEKDAKAVYPAESTAELQDFAEWERSMSEQSGGAHGEESADDEVVAEAGSDMRAVPESDGTAGRENGGLQ